ncbi:hypothetical protein [Nonomuraea pusilla]|uniref:ATP dependent DNA ligase n=1 Tax=Nonomuraea pusilla TaxID=46177 RepID=UPI000AFBDC4A|nr:hypothetical protein [Nonomuraea pusilla]
MKNLRTREVVIGGWKPGKGRRSGGIGSLAMGVFTDEGLDLLHRPPLPLETPCRPFAGPVPWRNRWVRPEPVGEVTYTMWTDERRLRHPVWRGLRPDRIPAEVRR